MLGLTKPDISTFPQVSAGEVKNRAVTPNLVISTDRNDLLGMVVGGQKIYLEYNPLERKKLNERFYEDEEVKCCCIGSFFVCLIGCSTTSFNMMCKAGEV